MGSIPVGFRFHPTEEEIISHYLTLKINGCNFDEIIPEIDLYKWEPWDLRGNYYCTCTVLINCLTNSNVACCVFVCVCRFITNRVR